MTLTEARTAMKERLPVHVPLGMGDAHYGVIIQVGYHESGNNNLVAVQGVRDLQWFHYLQVRNG